MADHRDGHATTIELTLSRFEEFGDRVAITVDDGTGPPSEWTFRDVLDRARREARRLDGLGVRRGDVVAIMAGTTPAGLVMRWAANIVGAAFTSFADGFSAPAVASLLGTCSARFLVTDGSRRAFADRAAARAGSTTVIDVDTDPPADAAPFPVRLRPDDLASISLTGGSTGIPKGVPRYAAVPAYSSPAALAGWHGTVQLACTPIAHIAGTIALVVLAAGGRVVLQPSFDAGRVLAAIPREGVTTIQLMPRLLHQLLDHPDLPRTDTSSLRSLRIGSAPASAGRLGEALERFGPIVGQTYGSIEATTITTIEAAELARPELRGTVGRPVRGVTISVRDDDGAEVPTGTTGEVWVQSHAVMPGYVDAPEQTAAVLRDGWFRTGDLGSVDGDGYLTLAGRAKEVIFAEHARIYPSEVENCLVTHPGVAAAGVFVMADTDGVESAAAAVVPRAGQAPSPDALIHWVAEHRGPNVAPSEVRLVDDLPLTPSGKIDRAALRDARFRIR